MDSCVPPRDYGGSPSVTDVEEAQQHEFPSIPGIDFYILKIHLRMLPVIPARDKGDGVDDDPMPEFLGGQVLPLRPMSASLAVRLSSPIDRDREKRSTVAILSPINKGKDRGAGMASPHSSTVPHVKVRRVDG